MKSKFELSWDNNQEIIELGSKRFEGSIGDFKLYVYEGKGLDPFKYRYTLYISDGEKELKITSGGQEALKNYYYRLDDFPFERQITLLKSELERERALRMKETCANK